MNFRPHQREEPEINLIPFIDVLLVVLIFLMLSTTYSKFTELKVNLPTAEADRQRDQPKEVVVAVSSDGRYMVNKAPVDGRSVEALAAALAQATQATQAAQASKESVVIISADANATHQAVISVMEAARRQGLTQLTFAAQTTAQTGAR